MATGLSFLLFIAVAVVVTSAAVIPIVQLHNVRDDSGQFALQYVSGDGTVFRESGELKPTRDGRSLVLVKRGFYSYTSSDGVPVKVNYEADENGFRPSGSNLPLQPHQVKQ